jgi:hypothetical protein
MDRCGGFADASLLIADGHHSPEARVGCLVHCRVSFFSLSV